MQWPCNSHSAAFTKNDLQEPHQQPKTVKDADAETDNVKEEEEDAAGQQLHLVSSNACTCIYATTKSRHAL